MAPMYECKVSGDCGGGGGGSINSRSPMKMTYDAIKVISLDKNFNFKVIKDVDKGPKGNVEPEYAIKMIADMIAAQTLGGSMDLFQESISMKIVEKINEVLDGDVIPKGDIVNEDTIRRESRGNGPRRNSLLQRFVQLRR